MYSSPSPPSLKDVANVAFGLTLMACMLPVTLLASWITYYSTRKAHPRIKYTSLFVAYIRAEIDAMGLREQSVTERVLSSLPWVPWPFAWLATLYIRAIAWSGLRYDKFNLTRSNRIWGFGRDLLLARTYLIDKTIASQPELGQLVILGAGFDTRCYSSAAHAGRSCFEVDLPATQTAKREALAAAGVDASHVRFVGVNFNEESWMEKLKDAGFDNSRPSIFVLEGVSYYLPPDAVAATVNLVNSSVPGTVLALDYASLELVEGTAIKPFSTGLRKMGEPLLFGLGTSDNDHAPEEWCRSMGLRLIASKAVGRPGRRIAGALAAEVVPP